MIASSSGICEAAKPIYSAHSTGGRKVLYQIPRSQLQSTFDGLVANKQRVVYIDAIGFTGYEDDTYFNLIISEDTRESNWLLLSRVPEKQVDVEIQNRRESGFRLERLATYQEGSANWFALLFTNESGPAWAATMNLPHIGHASNAVNLYADGYRMVNGGIHVNSTQIESDSVFGSPGVGPSWDGYSCLFAKDGLPTFTLSHLNVPDLENLWESRADAGYYLTNVSDHRGTPRPYSEQPGGEATPTGGKPTGEPQSIFWAFFKKDPNLSRGYLSTELTPAEMQKEIEAQAEKNRRIEFITAYDRNGSDPMYLALFRGPKRTAPPARPQPQHADFDLTDTHYDPGIDPADFPKPVPVPNPNVPRPGILTHFPNPLDAGFPTPEPKPNPELPPKPNVYDAVVKPVNPTGPRPGSRLPTGPSVFTGGSSPKSPVAPQIGAVGKRVPRVPMSTLIPQTNRTRLQDAASGIETTGHRRDPRRHYREMLNYQRRQALQRNSATRRSWPSGGEFPIIVPPGIEKRPSTNRLRLPLMTRQPGEPIPRRESSSRTRRKR